MGLLWLWTVAACVLINVNGEQGGASLRGALEALQRRQRGRSHGPISPPADYDAIYEFLPPQLPYTETDYPAIVENVVEEEPSSKYIIKFLEENVRPPEAYPPYKIVKKKNYHTESGQDKKESAFRERSHHWDNDKLKQLFMDRNEDEAAKQIADDQAIADDEYAQIMRHVWSKFKNDNHRNKDIAPQGVVKLFKEKIVKKRYPDNWGPIAFKRKRSSGSEADHPVLTEYEDGRKPDGDSMPIDPNYNTYDLNNEDKDDLREEYAIAFQPLDDDPIELTAGDRFSYETVEKRFPVAKRSSGSNEYKVNYQKKRSAQEQSIHDLSKLFRGSAGTDPRVAKDLSKIFDDSGDDSIKNPVKRSSDSQSEINESYKPPQVVVLSHNDTHASHDEVQDKNHTIAYEVESHEQHGHLHHPGMHGKETEHPETAGDKEKPIIVKKKSIDWSDYFGIDKRKKKSVPFVNNFDENKLQKQYFETFNKEVIYPLNNFGKHHYVKRDYNEIKQNDKSKTPSENRHTTETKPEKKQDKFDVEFENIDIIDKKLKNIEGMFVDEALHDANYGEEVDTKEEQEIKEKVLAKLAAAYSLEKMRKALKEFKTSLVNQQESDSSEKSIHEPNEESKEAKRVSVKKEMIESALHNDIAPFNKVDDKSDDFEDEQGAGHYLNGKIEKQFSEGYMGGSGRHRLPDGPMVYASGPCPVLSKIVQRCREVDQLAGDRGQIFLPLCSFHQICSLCGEAPPTTCDLVFLSEADTLCEGDMGCQRAARSTLMTLRELHDSLTDELDGECEASPCLSSTLKMNINWQRAIKK